MGWIDPWQLPTPMSRAEAEEGRREAWQSDSCIRGAAGTGTSAWYRRAKTRRLQSGHLTPPDSTTMLSSPTCRRHPHT
jgi:hypothetical protein